MVHYLFLLAHWLPLWYTLIFYWPTGPSYYTHLSSTGPLALPIIHIYLLLAHWPPHVSAVHYYLLLAHWLSLWYTTIFYWPTGPPYVTLQSSPGPVALSYGTLPVSTGPLAVSVVHSYLLLVHWPFLLYTTIFYWRTGPTCLCGTLLSSTGPLALPMVHHHLLLAQWPSLGDATIFSWPSCQVLWYTTFFYWPTGCLCGTLALPIIHNYLLLTHWPPHVSVVHYYLLLASTVKNRITEVYIYGSVYPSPLAT